jgi:hypothetical protein
MATTSMTAPEAQATIGPLGRLTGVFFSPKATFEDIVRRPTWIAPLVLLTFLSLAVSFAINQRVHWREYMLQQIEKSSSAAQLSAEQKEQRIEGAAKFLPVFTYAVGFLGPGSGVLLVTLVMWGAYNLLGGANTNFGTAFGITAHAFLTGVVSSLLFVVVLYLRPFGTVDLENPVATNLAAFLPDESAKWLVALCKSIDIFSIWTLLLLAMGFRATNRKKLKGAKAFSMAFTVWAAYVVMHVAWVAIFS